MRGLNQRGFSVFLAIQPAIDQLAKANQVTIARAAGPFRVASESGTFRSERFPTLMTAGGAGHGGSLTDCHVSKFARGSGHAMVHLPIEDDSGTKALLYQNHDEISDFADFGATQP